MAYPLIGRSFAHIGGCAEERQEQDERGELGTHVDGVSYERCFGCLK